uniref:H15 domain-containing protein n=1 Tax=Heterorhabditis bacteriophora TaxID=37862 RepID=A0A1I7XRG0_HETBA
MLVSMANQSEKTDGYTKINEVETPKVLNPEVLNNENVKRDSVAKFALLNKKNLSQLGIQGNTPAVERFLYKLACEPPVVNEVQKFRKTYPNWEVSSAYFLQRLGMQYAGTKSIRCNGALDVVASDSKSLKRELSDDCEKISDNGQKPYSGEISECTSNSDWDFSDMDIGCGNEDDTEEAEKRQELFGVVGVMENQLRLKSPNTTNDEDRTILQGTLQNSKETRNKRLTKKRKQVSEPNFVTVPEIKPSVNIVGSKQAVVKRIKLEEGGEIMIDKKCKSHDKEESLKEYNDLSKCELNTSFFIPALSKKEPHDCHTKSADCQSEDNDDMLLVPVSRENIVSGENLTGCKQKTATCSASELFQFVEKEITKQTSVQKKVKLDRRLEQKGRLVGKCDISKQIINPKLQGNNRIGSVSSGLLTELHPSWAARRIQKEKQSARPQGKKKIFTDE